MTSYVVTCDIIHLRGSCLSIRSVLTRLKFWRKEAEEEPAKTVEAGLHPYTELIKMLTEHNMDVLNRLDDITLKLERALERQLDKSDMRDVLEELSKTQAEITGAKKKVELIETDQEILKLLRQKEMRAVNIARRLKRDRAYVSRRLSELVDAGCVERFRKGRKVFYRIREET